MRVTRGSTVTVVVPVGPSPTIQTVSMTSARGSTLPNPAVSVDGSFAAIDLTPAQTSDLDRLDITLWLDNGEAIAVDVAVVARQIVTVAQVLAEPDMSAGDARIIAAIRDGMTEHAEEFVGRALVGQIVLEDHFAELGREVLLDQPTSEVVRASWDATEYSTTATSQWTVSGDWPTGPVTITHTPRPLRWHQDLARTMIAAIVRDYQARGARTPVDTLSETFDGRTVRLAQPGRDKPTGTLALDTVLTEMRDNSNIGGFA